MSKYNFTAKKVGLLFGGSVGTGVDGGGTVELFWSGLASSGMNLQFFVPINSNSSMAMYP